MKFSDAPLQGIVRIDPLTRSDERGSFTETYVRATFAAHGIREEFVQDNHSVSAKGVLRGLHFQTPPKAQAKLVRVTRGAAFDVVVDLRRGSPTYGRWHGETLDAAGRRMLYIPAGFAHGFLSLEEGTEFLYKVSDVYSPEHDRGLLWNDPDIGIAWPSVGAVPRVSPRDAAHPRLKALENPF